MCILCWIDVGVHCFANWNDMKIGTAIVPSSTRKRYIWGVLQETSCKAITSRYLECIDFLYSVNNGRHLTGGIREVLEHRQRKGHGSENANGIPCYSYLTVQVHWYNDTSYFRNAVLTTLPNLKGCLRILNWHVTSWLHIVNIVQEIARSPLNQWVCGLQPKHCDIYLNTTLLFCCL